MEHLSSRACDICRKKKLKCDKIYPICQRCVASKITCSYNDIPKKRGPLKG
ncbi:hypothetical protein K502DRAFT_287614, partial [Neoconidiobolus thromboides FSU 785]